MINAIIQEVKKTFCCEGYGRGTDQLLFRCQDEINGWYRDIGKNVNGPDKNCPVLTNAYDCHLNSRIIRSSISV